MAQQVAATFPKALVPLLIVPAGAEATATAASQQTNIPVRIDCDGVVCQQHGATSAAVVVVRPDGYIGYRGQEADTDRLLGYLDKYLVGRTSAG